MKNESAKRIGTAVAVLGSIIGTYFYTAFRSRSRGSNLSNKQKKENDRNLLTPAPATFGVMWPIIYTGTSGLVIHQAMKDQLDNPRYRKAVPWFLTSYLLNDLFTYFFAYDEKKYRRGAALTTLASLPSALALHDALEIGKTDVPQPERTLRKSISLYTGWLTAASVISIGNLILQSGVRLNREESAKWTYGILTLTGGLGMFISKKLNDPYYLLPFVAAYAGIAAKQYEKETGVAICSSVWASAILLKFLYEVKQENTVETIALEEENE